MAATTFSCEITIDGTEITNFSTPQISFSADGYGTEGVCAQQLTFSVPASQYASAAQGWQYGATVKIMHGSSDDLPTFYLSGRAVDGNTIRLTCYDATMFLDVYPDLTDVEDKETIPITPTLASIIRVASENHLTPIWGDFIGNNFTNIEVEKLKDKKVRQILTELSKASCGYFAMHGELALEFHQFGETPSGTAGTLTECKQIYYGFKKTARAVRVSNGSDVYGSISDAYSTMKIETIYASESLASSLKASLGSYTGWSCEKARINFYPRNGSAVSFGDEKLIVNNLKMKLCPDGRYVSIGRNCVSESEYCTRTERELDERIKLDTVNGNTKINRDGMKFVFRNENSESEEYGFEVTENGVTSYDGAVIDKTMPDSIVKLSDTCRQITYGGTTYQLDYEVDGDGNKTNIKFERLTNDDGEGDE